MSLAHGHTSNFAPIHHSDEASKAGVGDILRHPFDLVGREHLERDELAIENKFKKNDGGWVER